MRGMLGHLSAGFLVLIATVSGATASPCGRLVAWGWNDYGQCDVAPGDDFVAVSAGWKETLALREDGSMVAWGDNRLGSPPSGHDHIAISCGGDHAAALRADGSIVVWGSNHYGQCDVPPGNDFAAVAAGENHCLALREDGSLVSWGRNNNRLVDDTPTGSDFVAIAVGSWHSAALRSDGAINAWGYWEGGEPVPSGTHFVAIGAGGQAGHTLALRGDGTLVGWGSNFNGESDPPQDGSFVGMSCGARFSIAQEVDGSLVAWGRNDAGETDVPSDTGFLSVSCGTHHAVGIMQVPTAVNVDIKPGSDPNSINLMANGVLPVAILGSDTFDVAEIDQATLALAGAAPLERGNSGKIGVFEDVNSDGFLDLMLRFPIPGLVLEPDAIVAELTGDLLDGMHIVGSDSVRLLQPGDANLDNLVDTQDFGILKAHFGRAHAAYGDGDFNEDTFVDTQDFGILKAHFGQIGAAPAPAPEPGALALLGAAVPFLLKRRSKMPKARKA